MHCIIYILNGKYIYFFLKMCDEMDVEIYLYLRDQWTVWRCTYYCTYPQSYKHNLYLYKNCTSWRKYNILVLICPYCPCTSIIRTDKEGGGLLMITQHMHWILTFGHWVCVPCLRQPSVWFVLALYSLWRHTLPSWVVVFGSPWILFVVVLCSSSFSYLPGVLYCIATTICSRHASQALILNKFLAMSHSRGHCEQAPEQCVTEKCQIWIF